MVQDSAADKPAFARFRSQVIDAPFLVTAVFSLVKRARLVPVSPATAVAVVLLVLAGLLAYQNSYDAPFVFDDVSSIVENPTLHSLAGALSPPLGGSLTVEGRPLLNLSFALNHAFSGLDPTGYRATNVALHVLAALTLYGIIRRTLAAPLRRASWEAGAWPVALVAALIWELHPLQTESVTYVVQRAESLMGLLYLFTFYAFIRGSAAHDRRVWLRMSVVACFAGMAVKEVMATAPLLVLLHDRTFVAGSFAAAWRERRGYYLALAGTWLLLAVEVGMTGGNRSGIMGLDVGVSWGRYVLGQSEAVVRYLGLCLWPSPLVFEYGAIRPRPWPELLPWLAVTGPLFAGTLMALRLRPVLGYLGAWFFVILAPTSLVPSTTQMIVEHRLYLPLAAVVALVVAGVRFGLTPPLAGRTLGVLGTFGAAALLALTVQRNRVYASEISLWRDTLAKRPDNALAHHILGEALEKAGANADALVHYGRAAELRPEFVLPRGGLGRLLLQAGRDQEARRAAEQALALQSDYFPAREVLGTVLAREGRPEAAVVQYQAALAAASAHTPIRFLLAGALARSGRTDESIVEYSRVVEEQPDHAAAHFNRANLLRERGRMAEAIEGYRDAIRAGPAHAGAHSNLATLLASSGRWTEAVEHYRTALQVGPGQAAVHHNLGLTLVRLGRVGEAVEEFETALRLNPALGAAQAALEEVRASVPPRVP